MPPRNSTKPPRNKPKPPIDPTEKLADFLYEWSVDPIKGVRDLFGVHPTKQQEQLINDAWNPFCRVAVSSCTGAGKFLCNYERLHTPTGLKAIGDFKVGDAICNSYSGVSTVTGVYPQGSQHIYRIHFNNGTHVDSGLEHLWTVADYHTGSEFKTLSLESILDRGIWCRVKSTKRAPSTKRLRFYLPQVAPVYKRPQEVPVDPYTLGVWLGDGTRCSGDVTNIDPEVWNNIPYQTSDNDRQTKTVLGLITDLKRIDGTIHECGSREKYIPITYLENSIEVRMEVLRGLMDTDGTVDKEGHLTYYTTSERLAKDFIYLIRSLGGTTKGSSVKKTTHSDCYCIHFQFNRPERLFKIERKEARRSHKTNSSRVYIESVEYIGKHEATCIEVDSSDRLYLCENFIPTHNTTTLAWLTFLLLLTQDDCRVLVTSPSAQQLQRVYYAELLKWKGKMPRHISQMFEITRERVQLTMNTRVQIANLVTASADNKESLQGGHSKNYVILADEASGIDDSTFDVLQRTLSTGTGGRFILCSNPTRASGRFYEIFHRENMTLWNTMYFSAYECPHISEDWVKEVIEQYGEDSDQYRIGVLGQFPRATDTQFISSLIVDNAMANQLDPSYYRDYPIVIGADIARFGDDETVFVARQGPKLLNVLRIKNQDTQEVAGRLMEYQNQWRGTAVYIDAIGIGAGVYDRCKVLGMPVYQVISSNRSAKPLEYFNVRSQLWGEMKNWLMTGASIPYMPDLRSQLVGMTYGYNSKMQLSLTTKKDLKKLGLSSPDIADAIALTFGKEAYEHVRGVNRSRPRQVVKSRFLYV